jgi:competence protein ComEA
MSKQTGKRAQRRAAEIAEEAQRKPRLLFASLRLCVEKTAAALLLCTMTAWAQNADPQGKAAAARICIQCHEYERSISPRQNRAGWQATMDKMIALGAKGTQKEFDAIVDYLADTYPGEDVPKINVNEARAVELESGLSLPRSQASAIVQYRAKNGDFKSLDDLKKVPGVDVSKIEAKKDRLIFK